MAIRHMWRVANGLDNAALECRVLFELPVNLLVSVLIVSCVSDTRYFFLVSGYILIRSSFYASPPSLLWVRFTEGRDNRIKGIITTK